MLLSAANTLFSHPSPNVQSSVLTKQMPQWENSVLPNAALVFSAFSEAVEGVAGIMFYKCKPCWLPSQMLCGDLIAEGLPYSSIEVALLINHTNFYLAIRYRTQALSKLSFGT